VLQLKGDILFDLLVRAVKATSILFKPSLAEGEVVGIHAERTTLTRSAAIKSLCSQKALIWEPTFAVLQLHAPWAEDATEDIPGEAFGARPSDIEEAV
jgi:hypothetical protein